LGLVGASIMFLSGFCVIMSAPVINRRTNPSLTQNPDATRFTHTKTNAERKLLRSDVSFDVNPSQDGGRCLSLLEARHPRTAVALRHWLMAVQLMCSISVMIGNHVLCVFRTIYALKY
jgi:hypothetical protein